MGDLTEIGPMKFEQARAWAMEQALAQHCSTSLETFALACVFVDWVMRGEVPPFREDGHIDSIAWAAATRGDAAKEGV